MKKQEKQKGKGKTTNKKQPDANFSSEKCNNQNLTPSGQVHYYTMEGTEERIRKFNWILKIGFVYLLALFLYFQQNGVQKEHNST